MRSREEIERDPKTWEATTVEVLLDIRQLLKEINRKKRVAKAKKEIGRPKKVK